MEKLLYKIDVYVLCYNEIKIAPFAVQYWKRYANRVYVYDNGSTDGTIEYLKQFPELIEVRHFDSDGMNDLIHLMVKDNWKRSRGVADFVAVLDFDEFLYAPDLMKELDYMRTNGMTIVRPRGYNMICREFPAPNNGELSHEFIKTGVYSENFCKCVLFDPNKIQEMNYTAGCHMCSPSGTVKWYDGNKIFIFHHKYIGFDYFVEIMSLRKNRLSKYNKDRLFGVHYLREYPELKEEFDNMLNDAIDVTELY